MFKRMLLAGFMSVAIIGLALAQEAKKPEAASTSGTKGKGKKVVVLIETSLGNIKAELYPDKAPKTVANFEEYMKAGFFDGTIFHRIVPGFVIQGGGFTKDMMQKKTNPPIPLESQNGLKNTRGTLAMARTQDPNSATSQFFINLKDNQMLDYPNPDKFGYAVFGKVVEGLDVVDKIAGVATATVDQFQNVPVDPIIIKSVKLLP
jgi:peptidyl-prolyl cis-trans isomerase A (cyclophilin A)